VSLSGLGGEDPLAVRRTIGLAEGQRGPHGEKAKAAISWSLTHACLLLFGCRGSGLSTGLQNLTPTTSWALRPLPWT
jgi:hypothetical protein